MLSNIKTFYLMAPKGGVKEVACMPTHPKPMYEYDRDREEERQRQETTPLDEGASGVDGCVGEVSE